jgi:hypothetical protein
MVCLYTSFIRPAATVVGAVGFITQMLNPPLVEGLLPIFETRI